MISPFHPRLARGRTAGGTQINCGAVPTSTLSSYSTVTRGTLTTAWGSMLPWCVSPHRCAPLLCSAPFCNLSADPDSRPVSSPVSGVHSGLGLQAGHYRARETHLNRAELLREGQELSEFKTNVLHGLGSKSLFLAGHMVGVAS